MSFGAWWLLLLPCCLSAQTIQRDLFFLASDSLEGRAPGGRGAAIAADYIEERFRALRLVRFQGQFRFPFDYFDGNDSIRSENIAACTHPRKPCRLVITAHYDHLGYGNAYSRQPGKRLIHNGADDNASGVALLLHLAQYYQKQARKLPFSVLFVALSGHETGLHGAGAFAPIVQTDLLEVRCVLNLDMVGRLDTGAQARLFLRLPWGSTWGDRLLDYRDEDLLLLPQPLESPLDHTAFYEAGIPLSGTFSTGIHDDYHRSSDDAEKINLKGIERIAQFLYRFIDYLNLNRY